jgi:hypothetical protein
MKDDLYVEAGTVFLEHKTVVPRSLRPYVLKLLHKGHAGIKKPITKAHQLFFWPSLSQYIEMYVKKCRTCEKHQPANFREPLMPHSVPKLRFEKLGADILDYAGKTYLILVIKYILFKNSPMQPFEFVIMFNMTTCFGKIKFPSSGPRYTVRCVV